MEFLGERGENCYNTGRYEGRLTVMTKQVAREKFSIDYTNMPVISVPTPL